MQPCGRFSSPHTLIAELAYFLMLANAAQQVSVDDGAARMQAAAEAAARITSGGST
jgi:hypothetical protein